MDASEVHLLRGFVEFIKAIVESARVGKTPVIKALQRVKLGRVQYAAIASG
jgi:hypothetical protein